MSNELPWIADSRFNRLNQMTELDESHYGKNRLRRQSGRKDKEYNATNYLINH